MARKTPLSPSRDERESGRVDEQPALSAARHHAIGPGAASPADGGSGQETYAVGYGRPPLHSRFKPGKSGNPKGRAKQSRDLRTIVKEVSNEQIEVRERDRPRRMSRIEALVRATFTRAFKDPKAIAPLIGLMRQCGFGANHNDPDANVLLGPEYKTIVDDFLASHGLENTRTDEGISAPTSAAAMPARRKD